LNEKEQLNKELLELLEAKEHAIKYNKLSTMFPLKGKYSRDKYPKQMQFFAAGKDFMERALIAANRTGKTTAAGTEVSYHLTGRYPEGWQGRVFHCSVEVWAAGDTAQTTRDVIQNMLLGHIEDPGTGLIPRDAIVGITRKAGVPDAVETIIVKHASGDNSHVTFKSYDQKRKSFQGTFKHLIWLDEEPSDAGIYTECLTRLINDNNPGMIMCTFTPLYGLSPVVLEFLPGGEFPRGGVNGHKYVLNMTWDDVPHLPKAQRDILLAGYSKFERDARTKGIPSFGAGRIYPYFEEQITVEHQRIPSWFPRVFGFDTGWNRNAAVWIAMDPDSKVVYVYDEYYVGHTHPAINAHAIKGRGNWMYGACDPDGVNQEDGRQMFQIYCDEGLNLIKANKREKDATILLVGQMMESGQLKIIADKCPNLLKEIRLYSRKEDGRIADTPDHAIDALHYAIKSGMQYLELPPDSSTQEEVEQTRRDEFTGY
jgi:phage terminase large subunit-like protein